VRRWFIVRRLLGISPLILALGACGGSSDSNDCAARTGAYRIDFVLQSGTCQAFDPQVFTMDPSGQKSASEECVGHEESPSSDNCSAILKVSCPAGVGYVLLMSGTVAWNKDGSQGTGSVLADIQKEDGTYPCTSTYATTYTKR